MAINWIEKIKKAEEEEEKRKEKAIKQLKTVSLPTASKSKSVVEKVSNKTEKVETKKEKPKFDYANLQDGIKRLSESTSKKENENTSNQKENIFKNRSVLQSTPNSTELYRYMSDEQKRKKEEYLNSDEYKAYITSDEYVKKVKDEVADKLRIELSAMMKERNDAKQYLDNIGGQGRFLYPEKVTEKEERIKYLDNQIELLNKEIDEYSSIKIDNYIKYWANKVAKGFVSGGESLADFLIANTGTAVTTGQKLFGVDEETINNTEKAFTDMAKVDVAGAGFDNVLEDEASKLGINNNGRVPQIVEGVARNAFDAVTSWATGGISTGASVGGSYIGESLNDGANLTQATVKADTIGLIVGKMETWLNKGFGLTGESALSKLAGKSKLVADFVADLSRTKTGRIGLKAISEILEGTAEVGEEFVEEIIDDVTTKAIYDRSREIGITGEEAKEIALMTYIQTVLLRIATGQNISNAEIDEAIKIAQEYKNIHQNNSETNNVVQPEQTEIEVLPTAKTEVKQEEKTELPTANSQPILKRLQVAGYVNENNVASEVKNRMQSIVNKTNKIANSDVQLQFASLEGNKKAQTDGNTITIDVSKASLGDLIHEITHNVETSKGYIEVSDYILTELDKRGELQAIKDEIRRVYEPIYISEGRTFTEQDLDSEIVARYTEKFASDENFVNRITQTDRNFAQKIYDWIKEKVNYYKTVKTMTTEQRAEYDELIRAEKLWLNALKQDKNINNNEVNTKYAFKTDKHYGSYWNIETRKDIFNNITNKKALQSKAYDYILNGNKNFETIIDKVNNKEVKFTRISAREFVYGRNGQNLQGELYNQKMRTAPSIDDLINNASITYHSPLTHSNSLFKDGYDNYQGKMGIDDNIFSYIVRIGRAKNDDIFYDISLEHLGKKNRTDNKVLRTITGSSLKSSSIDSITSKQSNVNTTNNYSMQGTYKNTLATAKDNNAPKYSIANDIANLPKLRSGYTRLYRGLIQEYNANYDKKKLDNNNGYESWTDSYELAKAYGDNVYYIDVPTNQISKSIIDEDSASETYGERNLIYENDKPVGIKGKSGKEYILYTDHENHKNIQYNKIESNNDIRYSLEEDTKKERKHYKSIATSEMVGEQGKKIARNLLENDRYIPVSNQNQMDKAISKINNVGLKEAVIEFRNKVKSDKRLTPDDLALGERLIQEYSRGQDIDTLNELIQDVALAGTELGQSVQALSLIQKMTPEGQLMLLQKSINRINLSENTDIKLTKEQTKKIVDSKNEKELQEAISKATIEIAEQIPLKITDKLRSWRYLSMLGNPRTHIRNIVSNVAMKGTKAVKDTIASAIEDVINPTERTRTLKRVSKEAKEFAKMDAEERIEMIANGGKYDINTLIKQSKRQFNNRVLNALAEFNSNALEAEDKIFLKSAYTQALSNYMTANNLTAKYLQSGTKEANIALTKARDFATLEAQIATFRQFSYLATWISQLENKNNFNKVVVGGLLPFKKTPINIARTGIEYSPVGFIKSMSYDMVQLKKGNINASKFIDNISKGLTGTSISLIGYFLAQAGILKASGDDDDRAEDYNTSIGNQQYAINVGNKSFTIDWLTPSAMPLFVGAEFYNATKDKNEINLNALATATTKTLNPLTEMSMLQSFASTLSSFNTEGSAGKLGDMGANMIESYIGQYFPTIVGQLARIIDDTERETYYTDKKGAEARVQRFVNKQVAKTPFLSKILEPRVDVWGEEVKRDDNIALRAFNQLINPAYVKTVQSSNADKEVQRLYKASEDSSVLPKAPGSTFSIDAVEYKLTPEEYTTFKKTVGKYNKNVLNNIATKKEYTSLSDVEKIKTIEALYKDSTENAKQSYADENKINYDSTDDVDTLISKKNLSLANAYIYRGNVTGIKSDKDSKGETIEGSSSGNKAKYIMGINTTDEQKNLLLSLTTSSKVKPTVEDLETLGEKNYSTYYSISNAESREKYVDLVSTGMNTAALNKYIENIGSIEGKKDSNGKTISGTLKTAKANYINSLNLTRNEKLLLFGKNYELSDSEKQTVLKYVNSLSISSKQKLEILSQLKGVTIKNNKVYW